MDRGNSKHGPHLDEQMAEEVRGYVQGGAPTRAEEWKDPEPPGEDQPDILMDPDLERAGTPPGMNPQDVEGRYELARYLRYTGFPADRDALQAKVFTEDDVSGAAAAANEALGAGPITKVSETARVALMPWVTLAAFVPLGFLLWRRNL